MTDHLDARAVRMVDVAKFAGVSQTTASRALSGFKSVSPATRAAVEEAAQTLGYEINLAARSLASRGSQSIGFVVAEPSAHLWGGTYFPRLLQGITEATEGANQQLAIFMPQPNISHQRLRRYLAQGHVDGLLLITSTRQDPLLVDLMRRGMPVVVGGRPIGVAGASFVDVDNSHGAAMATSHLFERGYCNPAHIAGPTDTAAGEDRLSGYCTAMTSRGRTPVFREATDFSFQQGAEVALAIMREHPETDAIFAAGDSMAMGALTALRTIGRDVPGDVGLIGFDSSEPAAQAIPPLSSIYQPVEQLGSEMVRLILARVKDPAQPAQQRILGTRLVARDSSSGPVVRR
ncbi:LacI family transcriptional regulator [Nakamurella antarctica]|uniref:LacI family transcriptional regulator n=1 Tax=Nakamurella antarctica TaxID=1902245 RepID=A0A3G8ZP02_9ACTN|nr:LacI family DNA-binding transcriptional regulator [Nakamurella antarctica]AZI58980.1 LacI family transcriptional regulator [Nakamurella antarctica]